MREREREREWERERTSKKWGEIKIDIRGGLGQRELRDTEREGDIARGKKWRSLGCQSFKHI